MSRHHTSAHRLTPSGRSSDSLCSRSGLHLLSDRDRWIHPFLSCSGSVLVACAAVGALSGVGGGAVLSSYASAGAGAWISAMMGPTVVSFAFQLYRFRVQVAAR